ncbi:MAG: hypothetical protein NT013_17520 [Planctomycetia bacterium]|nr:hypothetical protein [Planctomycetia bacterium]
MTFSAHQIGGLAVCLWLSLAAANQFAADPPSHQPSEAVLQSHREPEHPFPKPKRNDQLEELQKQQIEIHDILEKGQENLKKLDESIKKREQEEADRAKTIAEQKEARFARGSVSRLVLIGVVGLLILVYRTFKNPEH